MRLGTPTYGSGARYFTALAIQPFLIVSPLSIQVLRHDHTFRDAAPSSCMHPPFPEHSSPGSALLCVTQHADPDDAFAVVGVDVGRLGLDDTQSHVLGHLLSQHFRRHPVVIERLEELQQAITLPDPSAICAEALPH